MFSAVSNYVSNGDFGFPFDYLTYLYKQIYVWSFSLGAPNLDGIIRMPWRLMNVVVFAIFGNVAAAYFYLVLSVLIISASFWFFLKTFFPENSNAVNVCMLLLYVFNPAFLGNTSKIGLVAAAALLPLCLVALRKFFDTRRGIYMIIFFLALNYSLLHPFTFFINAVVSGTYALYLVWERRAEARRILPKLTLWLVAGLLLNSYIILAVYGVGSIDKAVQSQDIATSSVDYTDLLGVATTKNFVTALSLSKDIFKDYDFYSSSTQTVFLLGALGVVAVITVLLILQLQKEETRRKQAILVLLLIGLFIIFLSTGLSLAGSINNVLVSIPGGWIFRSPLKWQLYVPFFFFLPIAALLGKVEKPVTRRLIISALTIFVVAQSTYIVGDIYNKLIIPKTVHRFAQLESTLTAKKRVLYVAGQSCATYSFNNPPVLTELNQILNSMQLQVKHVRQMSLDMVTMSNFDYILTCTEDTKDPVLTSTTLKYEQSFENGAFKLYRTLQPQPEVEAIQAVYSPEERRGITDKAVFAESTYGTPFNYLDRQLSDGATSVSEPFESVTQTNIKGSNIVVTKNFTPGEILSLYSMAAKPYFYMLKGNNISISNQPMAGYSKSTDASPVSIPADNHGVIKVSYSDPMGTLVNEITDGSFEQGAWQQKVEDCYEGDDGAKISMKIDPTDATDGKNSIALKASSHVACTHHDGVKVTGSDQVLFSLKYKSTNANVAGYAIVFNDLDDTTVSESISVNNKNWNDYARLVSVPDGATQASVFIYGYPSAYKTGATTTKYDDVSLVNIPAITSSFFLAGKQAPNLAQPSVSVVSSTPARRHISVQGAKANFLVKIKETYNSKWQMSALPAASSGVGVKLASANHYMVNGLDDGWYVDINKICEEQKLCRQNSDGSYNMDLVVAFTPQAWFQKGLVISGLTLLAALGAVGYAATRSFLHRRDLKRNGGRPTPPPTPAEVAQRVVKKTRRVVRL